MVTKRNQGVGKKVKDLRLSPKQAKVVKGGIIVDYKNAPNPGNVASRLLPPEVPMKGRE